MQNLPFLIYFVFGITTLGAVGFFYKATNHSKMVLTVLLAWLAIQAVISLTGFYTITDTLPPRFALLVLPPFILITTLFTTAKVCLGLLVNIVVNATLSVPTPFQQFAFEQPNIAVLHFPFVWLLGCLVPMVLFAHLASIRRLLSHKSI